MGETIKANCENCDFTKKFDFVPPYKRPDWPVLIKVEGFSGVRDELSPLMVDSST
jgi:hypothetical protein